MNNGGGGIFRILPGPKRSGALDYFETTHGLNAKPLCELYGLEYRKASDEKELQEALDSFYDSSKKPRLLEVCTPAGRDANVSDREHIGAFKQMVSLCLGKGINDPQVLAVCQKCGVK